MRHFSIAPKDNVFCEQRLLSHGKRWGWRSASYYGAREMCIARKDSIEASNESTPDILEFTINSREEYENWRTTQIVPHDREALV